jgi:hypothetical protein
MGQSDALSYPQQGALGSGGRNLNRSADTYGMHASVSQQERA